eukprot:1262413-Prymnesium_polylepis.2
MPGVLEARRCLGVWRGERVRVALAAGVSVGDALGCGLSCGGRRSARIGAALYTLGRASAMTA